MRSLYPKITPNQTFYLPVAGNHQLYVETSGNPKGIPVIYLHGGPGGGCSENHRRYFDPELYHIILFDQRGSGQSKPSPSIDDNNLDYLIDDIEAIREYLNIEQWLVAGGSWGTTLALAYGIEHANRVLAFILRGIFLGTEQEYQWLYQPEGAARFFPEYYQDFLSVLPSEHQLDPLKGYYQLLTSDNELAVLAASKAWFLWELRLSSIEHHLSTLVVDDAHVAHCTALISSHYFNHHCFFNGVGLLERLAVIRDIPAIIIHGRYDMVCQLDIAHQLAQQWPNAQLQVLPFAGHSGFESQTIDAFCKAADTIATFLTERD